MRNKQAKQTQPAKSDKTTSKRQPNTKGKGKPASPSTAGGRVDVTGIVPENIRIDPDITEGHPGYEKSGDSEIIPPERLAKGEPAKRGDKSR